MLVKTIYQRLGVSFAAITIALLPVLGVAAPAFASTISPVAGTTAAGPLPGDPIPLKSIADLTSLTATAELDVNGFVDGRRTRDDLQAVLAMNDQGKSKITVTGGLLGELAAQVGGSLGGLLTPSSVDIYNVPQGSYAVANSLFSVCVKLPATGSEAMAKQSPQSLLAMLTSSDVARGKLVGQETYRGVRVTHYVIDGDAFLAAARRSNDRQLREFGEALWSAEDADLYLDTRTGYPVAFRGSYSGAYEPLEFEGDFDVAIDLTGVNTNPPVNLPRSCNRAVLL